MQLQSLLSPGFAAADTLIDVADILINGAHAGLGEASGSAWVYVYADAVGAPSDAHAATSGVMATTAASSNSSQGSASANGMAVVPTNIVRPFFTCSSTAIGTAAANAASGIGSRMTVSGATIGSILAHIGTMIVDPAPGQGIGKAGMRAYLRLENGKEVDFWNAEALIEPDPQTGAATIIVTDNQQLLQPQRFAPYTLPDGRNGFAIGGPGLDVSIPIPDLGQYLGQRVEINLESTSAAASQSDLPDKEFLASLSAEIADLAQSLPGIMSVEIGSWLDVAAEQLISADTTQMGVSLTALERAWSGSLKFDRPDLSMAIGKFRRELFGVHVDCVELPRVSRLDDRILGLIQNLRFRINGESQFDPCDLDVSVSINGREPALSQFSLGPRTLELNQTGIVQWSFDKRDKGSDLQDRDMDALGLKTGSNHIIVTVRAWNKEMLGSTDAFVVI